MGHQGGHAAIGAAHARQSQGRTVGIEGVGLRRLLVVIYKLQRYESVLASVNLDLRSLILNSEAFAFTRRARLVPSVRCARSDSPLSRD
jgi:hypothetical protein